MDQSIKSFLGVWILGMSLSASCASAEPSPATTRKYIPVPRLVRAKLSQPGIQSKFVVTLPSYRDGKFVGYKPTLLATDRFNFFDAEGNSLSAAAVAKMTPKMTALFLVDQYNGDFKKDIASVRNIALLSGGAVVKVIGATQSSGDLNSGGAIATVSALGLDKTFPAGHTANDAHGWLGRDDINKAFGDPDRYGWLHYDLGAEQRVTGLRIWNYNYAKLLRRAVRDIDVYVSNDTAAFGDNNHASWTKVADIDGIPQGPGHLTKKPYGSDHPIAKPAESRYLRLDVQNNWGNGWNTALSEVQIFALPDQSIFAVTADEVGKTLK